ncbi:MAG: hypothetical protein ACI35S_00255 [Anaeroplasma sp.]
MFLLNALKKADIIFFSVCIGIIVVAVAIYFLIPIINRKEYAQRRENLKKREETFRANLKSLKPEEITIEGTINDESEPQLNNDNNEA